MKKVYVAKSFEKAIFGIKSNTANEAAEFIEKMTGKKYQFCEASNNERGQYERGQLSFTDYFRKLNRAAGIA